MPYKEFDVSGIGKVTVYKRRGNRSLRLSVTPEGTVRVSIPAWAPYQAGLTFLMSRRSWVAAQTQSRSSPELLQSGMAVGKTRQLAYYRDPTLKTVKTSVRKLQVIVTYPAKLSIEDPQVQQAAQSACWRALRSEARLLLTPRLKQLAGQHGFTYRSINVKRMKTRWGSCDQHKNIVFNIFLVQLPWDCIDYVILHELAHTRALNHGPDFWHELEDVLPNAKQMRRKMRGYRPVLMSGLAKTAMA